ncbi:MAG: class I SAM-dependent methyltransferase [Acidimicrobiia bacterium]|nr:class I SAM-dependent methyltransferase [Acidimicrobiia bacterium]
MADTDALDSLWRRSEALTALYATLELTAPLPPLGDWAIDPLFAVCLVNVVLDCRPGPRVVVECGSGASTVVTAAALRRYGIDGHVTSLEQDPDFADVTRAYLRRHELDAFATVHTAPLVDGDHGFGVWYDTSALETLAGDVDLLVVDGPPTAGTSPLARGPALDVMAGRLAPGARVLVDDAMRPGEQQVLQRWSHDHPEVDFSLLLTGNGAALGLKR